MAIENNFKRSKTHRRTHQRKLINKKDKYVLKRIIVLGFGKGLLNVVKLKNKRLNKKFVHHTNTIAKCKIPKNRRNYKNTTKYLTIQNELTVGL